MAAEHSPLSHFDPPTGRCARHRHCRSIGNCVVYANIAAQDLPAPASRRAYVPADLLAEAGGLGSILRRAIEHGEAFADRELVPSAGSAREPRIIDLTVTPLEAR